MPKRNFDVWKRDTIKTLAKEMAFFCCIERLTRDFSRVIYLLSYLRRGEKPELMKEVVWRLEGHDGDEKIRELIPRYVELMDWGYDPFEVKPPREDC